MDSKLTKKRLSNFLSYEWVMMILAIAGVIIVFELIYSLLAVNLTAGQTYGIMFDQDISPHGYAFADSLGYNTSDSVFSYDVLELGQESNSEEVELLETRFAIKQIDILFTDNISTPGKTWDNRANFLIDAYLFQDMTRLKDEMKTYLLSFMNGENISAENLNKEEIESHFLDRMKKDNRFRSQAEKEKGISQEIERFEKLCVEYNFFEKAYEYGINNNWFYSYHKYEYGLNNADEMKKPNYQTAYDNRKTEYWGLNVGALVGGKVDVSEYFEISTTKTDKDGNAIKGTSNIVLLVADYGSEQTDLQYESVSVINRLIRNCVSEEVYKAW